MHFMVHYPSQILRFGQLVYAWTMRYEAKLRIMMRAAKASNFKNVCQTVAKRHQHLLCYYLHVNKKFLQNVEIGPCKLTISFAEESPEVIRLLQSFMSLSDDCIVSHPIYVKSNGVMFKKNVLCLFLLMY